MNTSTTTKLMDTIYRHAIGLDPWFFERSVNEPNFPPHNIVQVSDDHYRLILAVAGYSAEDIEITTHRDLLTISGKRQDRPSYDGQQMLYNGIAFRDFARQFKIGDHVYVDRADLTDGLLEVALTRRLPEEMKPKTITIGAPGAKPVLVEPKAA